jgi:hypothetical protein
MILYILNFFYTLVILNTYLSNSRSAAENNASRPTFSTDSSKRSVLNTDPLVSVLILNRY